MSDHQPPLFATYDLSVEFDKLVGWARKDLRDNWGKYSLMDDSQIHREVWLEAMDIRVLLDRMSFETEAEPDGKVYKFCIPFIGPEEMWHLYPVAPRTDILGEVFRETLILEYNSDDEATARTHLDRELGAISQVLEQQAARVAVFHAVRETILDAEIAKLRHELPARRAAVLH